MAITLKVDANERVKIITGEHKGKTGTVLCIYGYGTVSEFLELYEPAYEVLTEDGKVQARFNTEDIEPL
jgi:ribosomal protein L24